MQELEPILVGNPLPPSIVCVDVTPAQSQISVNDVSMPNNGCIQTQPEQLVIEVKAEGYLDYTQEFESFAQQRNIIIKLTAE